MPYVFDYKGRKLLLFCMDTGKIKKKGPVDPYLQTYNWLEFPVWKIYWTYLDDFNPQRLETGINKEFVECNPTVVYNNGKYILSVCVQEIISGAVVSFLYTSEGSDFFKLPSLENTYVSTSACTSFGNFEIISKDNSKLYICNEEEYKAYETNFQITRISSFNLSNELILLTGWYGMPYRDDSNPRTIVFNYVKNKILGEIFVEGEPVYKSSIFGNEIVFAKREGENAEQRRLYYSDNYEIEEYEYSSYEEIEVPHDFTKYMAYNKFIINNYTELSYEQVIAQDDCDCYIYVNVSSTCCLSCAGNCATAIGSGDVSASISGSCPGCNPYLTQSFWSNVSDGDSICPSLGGDCNCCSGLGNDGCSESGSSFKLYLYDKKNKKVVLNNRGLQVYYDVIKRRQKNLALGLTQQFSAPRLTLTDEQMKFFGMEAKKPILKEIKKPIVREISKKRFL